MDDFEHWVETGTDYFGEEGKHTYCGIPIDQAFTHAWSLGGAYDQFLFAFEVINHNLRVMMTTDSDLEMEKRYQIISSQLEVMRYFLPEDEEDEQLVDVFMEFSKKVEALHKEKAKSSMAKCK